MLHNIVIQWQNPSKWYFWRMFIFIQRKKNYKIVGLFFFLSEKSRKKRKKIKKRAAKQFATLKGLCTWPYVICVRISHVQPWQGEGVMMLCSQIQSLKHEGGHYLLPSWGWQACHETTEYFRGWRWAGEGGGAWGKFQGQKRGLQKQNA